MFLFLKKCVFCNKKGQHICDDCKLELAKYSLNGVGNIAYIYDGKIKDLIRSFKFNDKRHYAKALAEIFLEQIEHINFDEYDIVTYIPISKKRKHERGYNQCEIFTKEMCKLKKTKKPQNILKKDERPPQHSLSQDERRRNILGAFSVKGSVAGKKILIFDDVLTTGATLREAVLTLKASGASDITICAFAKTQI